MLPCVEDVDVVVQVVREELRIVWIVGSAVGLGLDRVRLRRRVRRNVCFTRCASGLAVVVVVDVVEVIVV